MIASLSEAQCLVGYFAASGSGLASLVASRGDGTSPPKAYVFREVAAAGFTNSWASCVWNFTDVAKVRVQAASSSGLAITQYQGFGPTIARICSEEGLRGLLLPGIVASCMRDLLYSGLSIGMYPAMKQQLFGSETGDIGLLRKFATGIVTGALFSGIVNPADLVKIRVQAEAGRVGPSGLLETGLRAGHPPQFANSVHAFVVMSRTHGVAGLFRGCSATVARAALGRGQRWTSSIGGLDANAAATCDILMEGVPLHMVGSFLSGLAFATASAPADIVKTRLMADTQGKYRGFADCLAGVVKEGGPLALFRGWTPSAARLAPHFTLSGVLMEQVRSLVGVGYFAA
mmetsp:Transcript_154075/g.492696  ORF Transcript_154075/g.492696 Transcript_154075/m.492696 type:complete len:345 (+) Transcript_154075:151-1185(+)